MSAYDLLERLKTLPEGGDLDWTAIREEVHDEFDLAQTSDERELLLKIFNLTMDNVERHLTGESLTTFQKARATDYNLFIVKESLIGENVSVDRIAAVTDRELAAGRMSPEHELRQLAIRGIAAPHTSPAALRAMANSLDHEAHDGVPDNTGGWISRLRAQHRRAKEIEHNPVIKLGMTAVRVFWTERPEFVQAHSPAFLQRIGGQLEEEVLRVAHADDPIQYNRDKLVELGTMTACYQVLLIDPAPRPDPTGLRGQLGISGQLGAYLMDLKSEIINLLEFDGDVPDDGLYDLCLVRYRQCHAGFSVLGALRSPLGDVSKDEELDWFLPLFKSQCALAEWRYRDMLKLPQTVSATGCSELVSLITLVQSGEKWPVRAWERRYGRTFP